MYVNLEWIYLLLIVIKRECKGQNDRKRGRVDEKVKEINWKRKIESVIEGKRREKNHGKNWTINTERHREKDTEKDKRFKEKKK